MKRNRMVCLKDLEEFASESLPRSTWGYLSEGSCEGLTQRGNQDSFKEFLLRPRVLRAVGRPDLSTTILGRKISMPVCVGPTALQGLAHADGEKAAAAAARRCDTCYCLPTISTRPMEEVAASSGAGLRWYQVYVMDASREEIRFRVRRAETLGFKALVLTVDAPVQGRRYEDDRNQFAVPPHIPVVVEGREAGEFKRDPSSGQPQGPYAAVGGNLGWDYVEWLVSITQLPIVVKGICTAEDAILAVKHGANGVWVSNHGGRMLDTIPGTLHLLAEVVSGLRRAGSEVEVFVDGGVRYGTDVLKALCLGARAVFIGQPVYWGLSYAGEEGVCLVLELLRKELALALSLSGCRNVRDWPGGSGGKAVAISELEDVNIL